MPMQGQKIALGRHVYKQPRCNIDLNCSAVQQNSEAKCRYAEVQEQVKEKQQVVS